jgi:hypothetical protein
VQAPGGPTSKGPSRFRRTPSLVQHPDGSHWVTVLNGGSWTGGDGGGKAPCLAGTADGGSVTGATTIGGRGGRSSTDVFLAETLVGNALPVGLQRGQFCCSCARRPFAACPTRASPLPGPVARPAPECTRATSTDPCPAPGTCLRQGQESWHSVVGAFVFDEANPGRVHSQAFVLGAWHRQRELK